MEKTKKLPVMIISTANNIIFFLLHIYWRCLW